MDDITNKKSDIWVAVQGAVIGKSHVQQGLVCQDKTFIYETTDALAVALADGAGSARLSHYGAETVTREVCKLLCEKFEEFYNSASPLPVKRTILAFLLDALQSTALANQCEPDDLASTLLAVVISRNRFLIIHLGDGVIAYTKDQEIRVATGPKNGEFANTTYFVTSPHALEMMQMVKGTATSINGFVLMSDGSEASLYSKQRREVAPVLKRLVSRLGMTSSEYMEPILQTSLEEAISRKTRDDCSLVLVSKHTKSYDELDDIEGLSYFGIQARRTGDASKRKARYQKILNALDTEKTDEELCGIMGLKDLRNFVKTWLAPLLELGYIQEVKPNVYRRTIHPRCSYFAEEAEANPEEVEANPEEAEANPEEAEANPEEAEANPEEAEANPEEAEANPEEAEANPKEAEANQEKPNPGEADQEKVILEKTPPDETKLEGADREEIADE